MDIGPSELIIVLVIVLLLFGSGGIANIGGEMGKAIAEFRKGLAIGADHDEPPRQQLRLSLLPVHRILSLDDFIPSLVCGGGLGCFQG